MYIKYASVNKSILLHKNYNLFKSKFHCAIVAVKHIHNQIREMHGSACHLMVTVDWLMSYQKVYLQSYFPVLITYVDQRTMMHLI